NAHFQNVSKRNITAVNLSFHCNEVNKSSDKNPLLVYHGLFGSKFNWRVLSTKLTEATLRKVYTLDVRDHGESPHTGILTYETMAIAEKFTNWSQFRWSCNVSPEKVEKLIVVDIGIKTLSTSPQSSIVNINLVKAMKEAIGSVPSGLSLSESRRKVDEHLKSFVPDEFVRGFLLMNLKKSNEGIAWKYNLSAIERFLRDNSLNDLKLCAPFKGEVLVIHGGMSDYVRTDDYESIREWFPNCKFECIPEGNHYLHIQCQQEFLKRVLLFINST
ncbi:alpha/beta hydrolase domain-containing protein 11-like protein, partial [Leptotrombidium deliense]